MTAVDTFTMKDGRKVTVDWLSVKSVMKVKKKDMKEISQYLKECIDFINSPQYAINFANSIFGKGNWEFTENGKCLTIYRP